MAMDCCRRSLSSSSSTIPGGTNNSFLKSRVLLLALTITASSLFLIALLFFLFYLYHTLLNRCSRTNPIIFDHHDSSSSSNVITSSPPLKLQRFSYKQLKSATNSFNEESNSIGKGGSGIVFRGVLSDGKSIAVKKLGDSSQQSDREFQNELQILGGGGGGGGGGIIRSSPFIVSLLGYCIKETKKKKNTSCCKKFLVYEFMPNRSLQDSLFGGERERERERESDADGVANYCLDWDRRFEIILDIASALSFLHLDCDPPIIHGDIKPSNVLLGSDYRAKISDFGLSRIKTDQDQYQDQEEGVVEFGFSQELVGRSEELLMKKTHDQPSAIPVMKKKLPPPPPPPPPVDSAISSEVDFSLALRASSSSSSRSYFHSKYNSRLGGGHNSKMISNLNPWSVKCSRGNEDDPKQQQQQQHIINLKGKEVCVDDITKEEDWSRFVPDDEQLCSIIVEHNKELNLNASSHFSPIDDLTDDTMQWGKDWWWRQDGSGELCPKDYVTEWIGSQICPSRNPDWDEEEEEEEEEERKSSAETPNLDNSTQLDKVENTKEPKSEELGLESSKRRFNETEDQGDRNCTKKPRKMQEWWKEEKLAEISKKGNKLRKLQAKWKKGFKSSHFELGRKMLFRKGSALGEQNQKDSNSNVEFSFRKGWKNKNSNYSPSSEMWSGDLFSRELSSTTSMRGTVCYVAPEYGGCGYLMEKADIYSLGVLILVIVSGRRPLHVLNSPMKLEKANLISWCRQLAQTGNVLELVDERLKDEYNKEQASLCINLALMCIKKMPELRPEIGEIVKILKGEMDLPSIPLEFSPSPPSKLLSRSRRRSEVTI